MTRPSDQTIQDVALIARNGIDRIIELERENERLRALCDDLFSDIVAASSLVPQDCGAYELLQKVIRHRRDRWAGNKFQESDLESLRTCLRNAARTLRCVANHHEAGVVLPGWVAEDCRVALMHISAELRESAL